MVSIRAGVQVEAGLRFIAQGEDGEKPLPLRITDIQHGDQPVGRPELGVAVGFGYARRAFGAVECVVTCQGGRSFREEKIADGASGVRCYARW